MLTICKLGLIYLRICSSENSVIAKKFPSLRFVHMKTHSLQRNSLHFLEAICRYFPIRKSINQSIMAPLLLSKVQILIQCSLTLYSQIIFVFNPVSAQCVYIHLGNSRNIQDILRETILTFLVDLLWPRKFSRSFKSFRTFWIYPNFALVWVFSCFCIPKVQLTL